MNKTLAPEERLLLNPKCQSELSTQSYALIAQLVRADDS